MEQKIIFEMTADEFREMIADTVRAVLMEQEDCREKQEGIYLTKSEAAAKLRISLPTLNRRIAAGEVPIKRLGRRVLIPRSFKL